MALGAVRFVLALMVLLNHLWLPLANKIGAHAVIAFYMISGFLMTKVVNEVYVGHHATGRFLLNRFLRIYPFYWMVLLATLAGLVVWPKYFEPAYSLIRLPVDGDQWFANLTLYRLTDSPSIVIPPAWSLFVEAFFYIVIGLIGRWRRVVVLWVLGSLVYTGYMVYADYRFAERYYPLAAASLFFSAGALLYFYGKASRVGNFVGRHWPLYFVVFVFFPLLVEFLGGSRFGVGFYGAAVLFLLVLLAIVNNGNLGNTRLDKLLGDLAYPIFLTHFFCVGLLNLLTGNRFPVRGDMSFVLSALLCLMLSLAFVRWVEPRLQTIRSSIRYGG